MVRPKVKIGERKKNDNKRIEKIHKPRKKQDREKEISIKEPKEENLNMVMQNKDWAKSPLENERDIDTPENQDYT